MALEFAVGSIFYKVLQQLKAGEQDSNPLPGSYNTIVS